ncbi:septation protein SepH [Ornithinicoccus hortensis]|uniref:DUF3071 family protein n=1 Tax=Ornithinicoccus hortensis TaxID=82346 RepID=A0A542YTP6_9MICO|nr:septation protein SepH [Ornithinicoccus hortensis]TQL51470.1 DUF3071 family protein [Ornithinicoccus hortensis]
MRELRFVAVHEDGEHLVLNDPEGDGGEGTEYLLAVDERLRAALRQRATGSPTRPETPMSPRAIQSLIRAGHTAEEIAGATGWDATRVARFEGPIVAEREHVATRARAAHVRGRAADGGIATLDSRVAERLQARGVEPEDVSWDATRPEGGQWTIVVSFTAANRSRQAAWRYEPAGATVEALDDEARWLSEDEQALPGGREAVLAGDGAGAVDLMATMRERSRARGRRSKKATPAAKDRSSGSATDDGSADPAALPSGVTPADDVLPLEDLDYDPATAGLPPAAGRPDRAAEDGSEDDLTDDAAGQDAAGDEGLGTDAGADGSDVDRPDTDAADADSSHDEGSDEDEAPSPAERLLGRRGRRRRNRRAEEATLADFFGPSDEEQQADDEGPTDEDFSDGELTTDELATDELATDEEPDEDRDDTPAGGPVAAAVTVEAGAAAREDELDEVDVLDDDAETLGDDTQAFDDELDPSDEDEDQDGDEERTAGEASTASADVPVDEPAPADDVFDLPEEPSADGTSAAEPPAPSPEPSADAAPAAEPSAPAAGSTPSRKKGRKSVPSWDEIMFGAQDRR